jgi:hypothetical protein
LLVDEETGLELQNGGVESCEDSPQDEVVESLNHVDAAASDVELQADDS